MLNRWTGNGRITSDPQEKVIPSKYSKNGKSKLVNYTVAVDRNNKNSKGARSTDFIRCTAWGSSADYLNKYVSKGDLLWNDGAIRTRRVKDKQNPKYYRYYTGVHIEHVGLAGNNRNKNSYKDKDGSEVKGEKPVMPGTDDSDAKNKSSDEDKIEHKKSDIIDDDLPF